eukprot:CAMPEP_0170500736 /NCGR_PEP_ID=MMETSP0208-20121228/35881_1 /TAXON_ID=197538 /ORGANISM="Strombidium inclinatum, Strain S3" /LENGTH=128 /DNA_ID=CAMNT_0010778909 /DNA_START=658 /DNA_END=1044 /DNA_ORIENTATION=-
MADLETNCANLLNPEFYTSNLLVYKGPGASKANTVPVEVTSLFSYSSDTNSYTEITISDLATQLPSTASQAAGQCTCTNYLKEVEYTVQLESAPTATTVFRIDQVNSITARVVLGTTSGACGEQVPVN